MKKISAKKRKETTRDRHLKWINFYSSKNFGIWVECIECKKWRRTFQYSESHEVPEHWCCSMFTLESGEKGSCNDPEEDTSEQYLEYCPGSVVWAKLDGYPWWPGMVDEEPDVEEFYWRDKATLYYNVTFLDEKPTRAWISERFLYPFLKPPKIEKGSLQKPRQNKYIKAISKAKERAESAMKMTIKDRLEAFSFAYLYKGHWPAAPNFEVEIIEKNGSNDIEDEADSLLKQLEDLESLYSTDTDDERTEKGFGGNGNNMTEGTELISEIPSFKKKTYNTKYLNDKDFIQEDEAIFPFMKKKSYSSSSSDNKTSNKAKNKTSLELNENLIPQQKKETKGVKREIIRKFTPRKQKNIDKTINSLNDDIIDLENSDSELENDKNLNSDNAPIENYSKVIRDLEENSELEVIEISLPKMQNYEENKTEKKSSDENPLEKKVFKKNLSITTEKKGNLSTKEETFKHMDETISKVSEFVEKEILDECSKSEVKIPVKTINEQRKKSVKQKNLQESCENNKKLKNKIEILEEKSTQSSEVVFETSDERQNESLKQKKSQNSGEKKKRSQNKIENKENTIDLTQVTSETNISLNANNFQSKIKTKKLEAETSQPLQVTTVTKIPQNVSNSQLKNNKQITATKKSQKNIKLAEIKKKDLSEYPKSSFSTPSENRVKQNYDEVFRKDTKPGNTNKERKVLKSSNQKLEKVHSSVKAKPNFMKPIKTDKEAFEDKIMKVKTTTETDKIKKSESGKENYQENLARSDENQKDSLNEKSTENFVSEECVIKSKENVPEVISTDPLKPAENPDDNFFYVSLSDEEMDCESLTD